MFSCFYLGGFCFFQSNTNSVHQHSLNSHVSTMSFEFPTQVGTNVGLIEQDKRLTGILDSGISTITLGSLLIYVVTCIKKIYFLHLKKSYTRDHSISGVVWIVAPIPK